MKSITLIIFGLVIAMHCANGANIYDQIKKNIATVKRNIKDAANRVDKEVNQVIEQNLKTMSNNKNLALNLAKIKINTEIALINNAGEKNPDCLKQYNYELSGVQLQCLQAISSCFDPAVAKIKSTKDDISSTIASIKGLETDIDRGTIDCVGASTPTDYMVCVTKVLAQANISLKVADSQSKVIVSQIKTKAEAIKDSVSSCSDGKVSTILTRLQAIRENVIMCVESN